MDFEERSYRRILILFGLICLCLLWFGIQLVRIQLFNYERFSRSAVNQRSGLLQTNPLRGLFYDRNGLVLRGIGLKRYVVIDQKRPIPKERLIAVLGQQFAQAAADHAKDAVWLYPVPLTSAQLHSISQLKAQGLKIITNPAERDPTQNLAWHLIGTVANNRGVFGLENLYNEALTKKSPASSLVLLHDGLRRVFHGIGIRQQINFEQTGVILTVDRRIQQIVEKTLDNEKFNGAVVVLDVQNGQILALASRPSVNVHDMVKSLSDPELPFLNRGISAYHPGSLFKLVLLSAGLDTGQLSLTEKFTDTGSYQIEDHSWSCTTSNGKGHGLINLQDALAYSCNPVFIEVALRLKPQVILEYSDRFGLGKPCNIGLKEEAGGTLPSGVAMTAGEQANMALGQQDVLATPLQIASLIQTIANDGVRNIPRLVLGTIDPARTTIHWIDPEPPLPVLKPGTAYQVQQMMKAVIDYGTGKEAQIKGGVAGKTGTAQTGAGNLTPDNAWFGGYAPFHQPKYVAVVFCEKGISGGKTAAPIFREIMDKVTKIKD